MSLKEVRTPADQYDCIFLKEVPGESVDGMDVLAMEAAARRAADYVRSGEGPFFLEAQTYRFRAHSAYDPELYRPKEEVERWKERDPIPALQRAMPEAGLTAPRGSGGHRGQRGSA